MAPSSFQNVSLVIPAYNAERFLNETLQAACGCVSDVASIIVIDDGSTDGTIEVVSAAQQRSPLIHLIRQSNKGVSEARNVGLAMVTTPFVCFLDADDLPRPNGLATLKERLTHSPDVSAAFGSVGYIDEHSSSLGRGSLAHQKRHFFLEDVFQRNPIDTPGGILFRTSLVQRVGGFRSVLTIGEDWEMYVRILLHGPFEYVPEIVLDYRIHTRSAMRAKPLTIGSFEPAIRNALHSVESQLATISPLKLESLANRKRAGILRNILRSSTKITEKEKVLRQLIALTIRSHFDYYVLRQLTGAVMNLFKSIIRFD